MNSIVAKTIKNPNKKLNKRGGVRNSIQRTICRSPLRDKKSVRNLSESSKNRKDTKTARLMI